MYILNKLFYLILLQFLMFPVLKTSGQINNESTIRLNQIGYPITSAKIAILMGKDAKEFMVVSAKGGKVIYKGKPGLPVKERYGNGMIQILDFSSIKHPGYYKILVPGVKSSYIFKIGNEIYRDVSAASIKSYYYQRTGIALEKQYAGIWRRNEGHPDTAIYVHSSAADLQRPEGFKFSSPRGWYDAGDYNKYIVNSGITMATLLSAYEDFPEYSKSLKLNIPESKDALPDLLNEALWNLRWMLTMQDPGDGGVYHKLTNAAFDGMVMPEAALNKRYVIVKTTAATLDLAAVMAQSARVFSKFPNELPGLADSCLTAATKAWKWASLHPDAIYDQEMMNSKFEPAITTGAYSDKEVSDEKLWAGTELYLTTKNEIYLKGINFAPAVIDVPSWPDVSTMAYYSLISNRALLSGKIADISDSLAKKLILAADQFVIQADKNPWKSVVGEKEDFIWGSNAVASNQGMLLLKAYQLKKSPAYLLAIQSNIDYLLGRNATDFCFVTGYGSHSPMHIHHRPSIADGITAPVLGLLAGGPNPGQQDKCSYPSSLPDRSYADIDCSYASNEVAINWNAPLVYLLYGASSIVK